MKNSIKKDFAALSQLITVSGAEQEAILYLKPRLEKCCDSVEVTGIGNLIATKKGKGDGPKVLLTAHMDEIGMSVKNILPNGFLLFEMNGGFSDELLPARKVWIKTRNGKIVGTTGMRSAHLTKGAGSAMKYIDIGAKTKQEALDMGVYIGSKIVFQSDFMELNNPDLICTKSADDKLCCSILLNIMETIKSEEFCGELVAAFSTMEETTISGIVPICNQVDPEYAIVMDTVPCGDVPDVATELELPVYLGKGPVMIVSQGIRNGGRYNMINPKIRELLYAACEQSGITMQELSISDKSYITEESLAFTAGSKGVPPTTVAVPRRYSHTPSEVADMNDANDMYKLLMQVIRLNGSVRMTFI